MNEKIFSLYKLKKPSGFSQVEIMVTILVISIVIMGIITTFGTIGKGLITSKTRTIANNLAQEKIEYLKNYSYARLLVTTLDDLANHGHDETYTGYTPETLRIGDATFVRYTTVWRAREEVDAGNTVISTMSPTGADEGIKKIKVEVTWTENNESKSLVLYNLRDDPYRTTLGGTIYGLVTTTGTAVGIASARVEVAQNLNWASQTSSTGYYLIKTTTPATIQLTVSKDGYWNNTTANFAVSANQNIQLTQKLTGTVTGWAMINDHLLISLIVTATDYDSHEQEYIQLFNPTTWAWTIDDASIDLYYDDNNLSEFPLSFSNTSVPSFSYYLIANTGTVYINNTSVTADATYDQGSPYPDFIKNSVPGGIILSYDSGTSNKIDSVAWGKNTGLGADPPSQATETTGFKSNDGPIEPDHELFRYHFTGQTYGYVSDIRGGGAYDSNINDYDFYYRHGIENYCPYNSSTSSPPVSGTPAYGAVISANDGLSSPTTAYYKNNNKPNAYFSLTVATGTWSIYITSGSYYREIANVSVNSNVGTAIPNSSTSPKYPVYHSDYKINAVLLSSPSVGGFITGRVIRSGTSTGISGIQVAVSGYSPATTDSNGYYNYTVAEGSYTIVANQDCDDINWTEDTKFIEVTAGRSVTVDNLELYTAGKISGITKNSSGDALPFVTVRATSTSSGFSKDTVSGSDGTYSLKGIRTATDVVLYPVLDSADSYIREDNWPTPINLAQGDDLTGKNFKITSVWGKIIGTVSDTAIGGNITTGVLIIATNGTVPAESPETINSTFRSGANIYYGSISGSSGTYEIIVRKGYTYNLRAWYTKTSGDFVTTKTKTGVTATAVDDTNSTVTVDFTGTWP
ncbi:MAG: hypothetical protein A2539_03895 [Elusimicrobia bacterium RIFOXYD2_FULL_34_15]|nr:MAG: hypothetical protein A2539_03895 [Elusimicrobia bacterium RIFOXYD2_FULL_34_15]